MIEPVRAGSQMAAAGPPAPPAASAPVSEAGDSSFRIIYGSSYSGVSFGSAFSPDNLLLTDRRPVRSRSQCQRRRLLFSRPRAKDELPPQSPRLFCGSRRPCLVPRSRWRNCGSRRPAGRSVKCALHRFVEEGARGLKVKFFALE